MENHLIVFSRSHGSFGHLSLLIQSKGENHEPVTHRHSLMSCFSYVNCNFRSRGGQFGGTFREFVSSAITVGTNGSTSNLAIQGCAGCDRSRAMQLLRVSVVRTVARWAFISSTVHFSVMVWWIRPIPRCGIRAAARRTVPPRRRGVPYLRGKLACCQRGAAGD